MVPHKAHFSISFHCAHCRVFLVDYEKKLSRKEVDDMAASLVSKRRPPQ